jgi:DNA processing protein
MIKKLTSNIPELEVMKKYPPTLYYIGNTALLQKTKVSIVGSRKPTPYTRKWTFDLAQKLSQRGVCIVSGAAMGVDAIAHQGAHAGNTIAVMGNGLDIRYPVINRDLIAGIEREGLVLSQFETGFKAAAWSFVVRNEIVAALGESLIVTQADPGSGSLRSVEYARKMGKKIYVLPQRIGESEGTNRLLAEGKAEAIYDIGQFADMFAHAGITEDSDPLLYFCKSNPSYEEVVRKFGDKLFAYELEGKVEVVAGHVIVR